MSHNSTQTSSKPASPAADQKDVKLPLVVDPHLLDNPKLRNLDGFHGFGRCSLCIPEFMYLNGRYRQCSMCLTIALDHIDPAFMYSDTPCICYDCAKLRRVRANVEDPLTTFWKDEYDTHSMARKFAVIDSVRMQIDQNYVLAKEEPRADISAEHADAIRRLCRMSEYFSKAGLWLEQYKFDSVALVVNEHRVKHVPTSIHVWNVVREQLLKRRSGLASDMEHLYLEALYRQEMGCKPWTELWDEKKHDTDLIVGKAKFAMGIYRKCCIDSKIAAPSEFIADPENDEDAALVSSLPDILALTYQEETLDVITYGNLLSKHPEYAKEWTSRLLSSDANRIACANAVNAIHAKACEWSDKLLSIKVGMLEALQREMRSL
jgi:hypothetical protein